jgi:hypothetical protein
MPLLFHHRRDGFYEARAFDVRLRHGLLHLGRSGGIARLMAQQYRCAEEMSGKGDVAVMKTSSATGSNPSSINTWRCTPLNSVRMRMPAQSAGVRMGRTALVR